MHAQGVSFSIAKHASWPVDLVMPDRPTLHRSASDSAVSEPPLRDMTPMLRRRSSFLGKMALEVAFQCLDADADVPTVFCSRHGEVARAVDLLTDLACGLPISPTAFSMAVHNASAGLFSIARKNRASYIALAAGESTIEHAVIEACGLLADGATRVLLVVSDCPLPDVFSEFRSINDSSYAWAWLMVAHGDDPVSLSWSGSRLNQTANSELERVGVEIARFGLGHGKQLKYIASQRRWCWSRND